MSPKMESVRRPSPVVDEDPVVEDEDWGEPEAPRGGLFARMPSLLRREPVHDDSLLKDYGPEGDEAVAVVFAHAEGGQCQRCWKVLPDVGQHGHDGVCARCDAALS